MGSGTLLSSAASRRCFARTHASATAATLAQASEIAGRDVTQPTSEQGGAVWTQTDEGREDERAEKRAARAAYAREWGAPPGEWA